MPVKSDIKVLSFRGYNDHKIGQHPTELAFYIRGPRGAVAWVFPTGIAPTGKYPSLDVNGPLLDRVNISFPSKGSISAHEELTLSNASTEEVNLNSSCEYLEGRACVCCYSTTLDPRVIKRFACEGIPGVEEELKVIYSEVYGEPYV